MNDHSKDIQDYFNQGFRGLSPTERTVKQILDGNNQSLLTIHKDPKETTTINYNPFSVFEQNSKYIPPIELVTKGIMHQANEMLDNKIHNEIVLQYGVFVDKEELVKALKYDRGQYEKGWNDGYNEATKKEIKTNFDRITASVESLANWIYKHYNCMPEDVPCPMEDNTTCNEMNCKECFKEWLQKECEG